MGVDTKRRIIKRRILQNGKSYKTANVTKRRNYKTAKKIKKKSSKFFNNENDNIHDVGINIFHLVIRSVVDLFLRTICIIRDNSVNGIMHDACLLIGSWRVRVCTIR